MGTSFLRIMIQDESLWTYRPIVFFSEYPRLLGLINSKKDKLKNLKYLVLHLKLTNVETLLTLAILLPVLEEMSDIMKKAQQRAMFFAKYSSMRKRTCLTLDNLYQSDRTLSDIKFDKWQKITDLDNLDNYLHINADGELCASVRGINIPMYYSGRLET